jgi:phage virion morphogenesis protein
MAYTSFLASAKQSALKQTNIYHQKAPKTALNHQKSALKQTMAQIQITITDDQLQAALGGIADRATDLTPALKDLGEHLVRKTRQRFNTSTAPDGTKWQPLAPSTIKAKQRRQSTGKPYRTNARPADILKDTFTLRDSITYQASSASLRLGTNIEYGIYHQSEEPRTRIPRRAFLGLDNADKAEAIDIIRDYLSS